MGFDGIQIFAGGSALTVLGGIAGAWIKARYGRTKVDPTPLPVEVAQRFVTCDQCQAHRDAIGKRFDAQVQLFSKVSDKLDLIEAHNEDRAKRMHDRIDPIIREAAATGEAIRQHLEDHRRKKS